MCAPSFDIAELIKKMDEEKNWQQKPVWCGLAFRVPTKCCVQESRGNLKSWKKQTDSSTLGIPQAPTWQKFSFLRNIKNKSPCFFGVKFAQVLFAQMFASLTSNCEPQLAAPKSKRRTNRNGQEKYTKSSRITSCFSQRIRSVLRRY